VALRISVVVPSHARAERFPLAGCLDAHEALYREVLR
jgi:hypothetical protein